LYLAAKASQAFYKSEVEAMEKRVHERMLAEFDV